MIVDRDEKVFVSFYECITFIPHGATTFLILVEKYFVLISDHVLAGVHFYYPLLWCLASCLPLSKAFSNIFKCLRKMYIFSWYLFLVLKQFLQSNCPGWSAHFYFEIFVWGYIYCVTSLLKFWSLEAILTKKRKVHGRVACGWNDPLPSCTIEIHLKY